MHGVYAGEGCNLIALLDSDVIGYRAAASCEPTKIKDFLEPLDVAIQRCDDLMKRILHETQADSYRAFLGGSENFRMQIDPNYKANRKDKPKPTWLQDVRAFLVSEWKAEICDGIEADDALGIHQDKGGVTNKWHEGEYATVICSIDKDLLQVPGNHYNFVKCEWTKTLDHLTGMKHFYQQLIQGDASDGIFGYDGKARPKIPQFLQHTVDTLWSLDNERDMYDLVFNMYDDPERFNRNVQLLYIQRKEGDAYKAP